MSITGCSVTKVSLLARHLQKKSYQLLQIGDTNRISLKMIVLKKLCEFLSILILQGYIFIYYYFGDKEVKFNEWIASQLVESDGGPNKNVWVPKIIPYHQLESKGH